MSAAENKRALATAMSAARAAGKLMRQNLRAAKTINAESQHDIKLELDVRCQKLIERRLQAAFPLIPILGEEGDSSGADASMRWVVDPIDGTVNFTYGIPHACVSIALQAQLAPAAKRPTAKAKPGATPSPLPFTSVVGVVYDPFVDEIWTAIRGQPARLNGRIIKVSQRKKLDEAVIALGFGKKAPGLDYMLPLFTHLVHRVRKLRVMGAAALDLAYVASGRFDAFIEARLRLWDIAAGGLILECAGGEFWCRQLPGDHVYEINGNNGRLRPLIERLKKQ